MAAAGPHFKGTEKRSHQTSQTQNLGSAARQACSHRPSLGSLIHESVAMLRPLSRLASRPGPGLHSVLLETACDLAKRYAGAVGPAPPQVQGFLSGPGSEGSRICMSSFQSPFTTFGHHCGSVGGHASLSQRSRFHGFPSGRPEGFPCLRLWKNCHVRDYLGVPRPCSSLSLCRQPHRHQPRAGR